MTNAQQDNAVHTHHLEKLVYTLTEAARLLGYKHEKTIRRMNDEGQIEIARLRNRWVVRREELTRLIENLPTEGGKICVLSKIKGSGECSPPILPPVPLVTMELAELLTAWPLLNPDLRTEILSLVRTSSPQATATLL